MEDWLGDRRIAERTTRPEQVPQKRMTFIDCKYCGSRQKALGETGLVRCENCGTTLRGSEGGAFNPTTPKSLSR